mmetsp:Transcript_24720/g.62136  ORF Transcript_24720/g.62136 Transcript_24720/m.62136 type:complete len:352 (-) Transcript_24720:728-1783(-)
MGDNSSDQADDLRAPAPEIVFASAFAFPAAPRTKFSFSGTEKRGAANEGSALVLAIAECSFKFCALNSSSCARGGGGSCAGSSSSGNAPGAGALGAAESSSRAGEAPERAAGATATLPRCATPGSRSVDGGAAARCSASWCSAPRPPVPVAVSSTTFGTTGSSGCGSGSSCCDAATAPVGRSHSPDFRRCRPPDDAAAPPPESGPIPPIPEPDLSLKFAGDRSLGASDEFWVARTENAFPAPALNKPAERGPMLLRPRLLLLVPPPGPSTLLLWVLPLPCESGRGCSSMRAWSRFADSGSSGEICSEFEFFAARSGETFASSRSLRAAPSINTKPPVVCCGGSSWTRLSRC